MSQYHPQFIDTHVTTHQQLLHSVGHAFQPQTAVQIASAASPPHRSVAPGNLSGLSGYIRKTGEFVQVTYWPMTLPSSSITTLIGVQSYDADHLPFMPHELERERRPDRPVALGQLVVDGCLLLGRSGNPLQFYDAHPLGHIYQQPQSWELAMLLNLGFQAKDLVEHTLPNGIANKQQKHRYTTAEHRWRLQFGGLKVDGNRGGIVTKTERVVFTGRTAAQLLFNTRWIPNLLDWTLTQPLADKQTANPGSTPFPLPAPQNPSERAAKIWCDIYSQPPVPVPGVDDLRQMIEDAGGVWNGWNPQYASMPWRPLPPPVPIAPIPPRASMLQPMFQDGFAQQLQAFQQCLVLTTPISKSSKSRRLYHKQAMRTI